MTRKESSCRRWCAIGDSLHFGPCVTNGKQCTQCGVTCSAHHPDRTCDPCASRCMRSRTSAAKTPLVMPVLRPRRKLRIAIVLRFVWLVLCQFVCAGVSIMCWLHGSAIAGVTCAVASLLCCTMAANLWRRRYGHTSQSRLRDLPW